MEAVGPVAYLRTLSVWPANSGVAAQRNVGVERKGQRVIGKVSNNNGMKVKRVKKRETKVNCEKKKNRKGNKL